MLRLGTLPWELVDYGSLSVSRGQLGSASAIQSALGSPLFRPQPGVDPLVVFETPDTWLWLSLVAADARMALEDDPQYLKFPEKLAEAKELVSTFLQNDSAHFWNSGNSSGGESDTAILIGKLSVCDRVMRLGLAHEISRGLRGALEALVSEPFYDYLQEISRLLDVFVVQQDIIQSQYDVTACE